MSDQPKSTRIIPTRFPCEPANGRRNRHRPQAGRVFPPEPTPLTHQTLLLLPFSDFARCIADLLGRIGYRDVRVAGRASGKLGKKCDGTGGYDISAVAPADPFTPVGSPHKVVILLKQFARDAWIYQRMIDELRGVALREGADEAILVTTGRFSGVIVPDEERSEPARGLLPVHRIDGDRLLKLLRVYGVEPPAGPDTVPKSAPRADSAGKGGNPVSPPKFPVGSGGTERTKETEMTLLVRLRLEH